MTESINATAYAYSGGVSNVQLDKEKFQLRHAVDKFFGTDEGWPVVHKEQTTLLDEVKSVIKRWTEKDKTRPNVFEELKRLKLMVCGGAVNSIFTGNTINDLDFYMKDPSLVNECKAFFKAWFPDIEIETINAMTYKRKGAKTNKR